jgi:hypothetical protein
MKRLINTHNAPALVLGVIAVVIAAAGGTYAATRTGGTIIVCVKHKGGALYKAGKCKKHDKHLSWNAQGPPGQQGATGATGATGAQGPLGPQGPAGSPRGWANVAADGAVENSGGQVAITIDKIGTGEYCLITNPDVGTFAPIVATLHGDSTIGFISVNDEFGNNCNPDGGNELLTWNSSGTATDEYFVVGVL